MHCGSDRVFCTDPEPLSYLWVWVWLWLWMQFGTSSLGNAQWCGPTHENYDVKQSGLAVQNRAEARNAPACCSSCVASVSSMSCCCSYNEQQCSNWESNRHLKRRCRYPFGDFLVLIDPVAPRSNVCCCVETSCSFLPVSQLSVCVCVCVCGLLRRCAVSPSFLRYVVLALGWLGWMGASPFALGLSGGDDDS